MTDTLPPIINPAIKEKEAVTGSGIFAVLAIFLNIIVVLSAIGLTLSLFAEPTLGKILGVAVLVFLIWPLSTVAHIQQPGNAQIYQFLGSYVGTSRRTGLFATLPFLTSRTISIKDQNFETPVSKVNDLNGNPINISAIVVWRVSDTAKAIFAVEAYDFYLQTQAEAAVRHVAATHPYDSGDNKDASVENVPSLLGSASIINQELFTEIGERAASAGVEIIEVRINNLAYSVEIAQAMLQRQQASAIIDARKIIVQGAVGIVEDAIKALETEAVQFTPEDRAALTSNLLIVLVGEGKVTPTLNVESTRKR